MTKKPKQIFKVNMHFELFVSAVDKDEAKEKVLKADKKIVCEHMQYKSADVEPTPYEILEGCVS